jgi:hypothetical protein
MAREKLKREGAREARKIRLNIQQVNWDGRHFKITLFKHGICRTLNVACP